MNYLDQHLRTFPMHRIARILAVVAMSIYGASGQSYGQIPMPGGNEELPPVECGPTLEITKQPVASPLQQFTIEFKWSGNTGIDKVVVKMLKKDNNGDYKVDVGSKTINTNAESSNSITKLFPTNAQPANTKVKIEITTKSMNGDTIKAITSNEVTLP